MLRHLLRRRVGRASRQDQETCKDECFHKLSDSIIFALIQSGCNPLLMKRGQWKHRSTCAGTCSGPLGRDPDNPNPDNPNWDKTPAIRAILKARQQFQLLHSLRTDEESPTVLGEEIHLSRFDRGGGGGDQGRFSPDHKCRVAVACLRRDRRLRRRPDLIERHRPHLMVAEPFRQHGDGIMWIKNLHANHRQLKILVASSNSEATYAERLLRAGASGYWMNNGSADGLVRCDPFSYPIWARGESLLQDSKTEAFYVPLNRYPRSSRWRCNLCFLYNKGQARE